MVEADGPRLRATGANGGMYRGLRGRRDGRARRDSSVGANESRFFVSFPASGPRPGEPGSLSRIGTRLTRGSPLTSPPGRSDRPSSSEALHAPRDRRPDFPRRRFEGNRNTGRFEFLNSEGHASTEEAQISRHRWRRAKHESPHSGTQVHFWTRGVFE